jgi:hypothetical protein
LFLLFVGPVSLLGGLLLIGGIMAIVVAVGMNRLGG